MTEKYSIELPEGFLIKIYEKSIVVGGSTLFFNREPTDTDIRAIKSIFSTGMQAKQAMISRIFNSLVAQIQIPDDSID